LDFKVEKRRKKDWGRQRRLAHNSDNSNWFWWLCWKFKEIRMN